MTIEIPIWRIKYLPSSLDEICGRKKVIESLKEIIKQKNFPHLLFVGSEGVGKTLIAKLFVKEFLGKYYDANFKVVYADEPLTDDERNLAKSEAYVSKSKLGSTAGKKITTPAFIQVKIKPFVQLKALGGAPFKIIIVKNFEALGDNQQGFRRLMEMYGSNCRMILITTKISGIIDPIVSRCQLFLLSQVDFNSFKEFIDTITKNESLVLEEGVKETLFKISKGRIHKAIDLLQLCSISGNKINKEILYENAKKFNIEDIKELLSICFKGSFLPARDSAREIISKYKYNAQEFFSLIIKELLKLPLSKFALTELISMIAEADFRAIDGRDDDIQMSSLLSKICLFSERM